MPMVGLDRLMQNGVMPREEDGQIGGKLLRQRGAALNGGEEERDCATGKIAHAFFSNA